MALPSTDTMLTLLQHALSWNLHEVVQYIGDT